MDGWAHSPEADLGRWLSSLVLITTSETGGMALHSRRKKVWLQRTSVIYIVHSPQRCARGDGGDGAPALG